MHKMYFFVCVRCISYTVNYLHINVICMEIKIQEYNRKYGKSFLKFKSARTFYYYNTAYYWWFVLCWYSCFNYCLVLFLFFIKWFSFDRLGRNTNIHKHYIYLSKLIILAIKNAWSLTWTIFMALSNNLRPGLHIGHCSTQHLFSLDSDLLYISWPLN